MNHDAIQTQRETWLRARIARGERERERDEGVARLEDAVTRAKARENEEEAALDALIAGAKASFDEFKQLPQTMVSAAEAAAVDDGAAFAEEARIDVPVEGVFEREASRLGPPTARVGFADFGEAAP